MPRLPSLTATAVSEAIAEAIEDAPEWMRQRGDA
jgi:hypothetical protein